MPFHFFTDYDYLEDQQQQTIGDFIKLSAPRYTAGFGKIKYEDKDGGEYDGILLSDTHRCKSDTVEPYAYAVCNGTIAVAPVLNSNLVNIILKPHHDYKLPIPKVKYFIYRGVLRDSLFEDSLNPVTPPVSTDYFKDGFPVESYYPYDETPHPPRPDGIIYKLKQSSTDPGKRNNLLEHIEDDKPLTGGQDRSPNILLYNKILQDTLGLTTGVTVDNVYLDSLFEDTLDNNGTLREVKEGWVIGRFPSASNGKKGGPKFDRFVEYSINDTNDKDNLYKYLSVFSFEIILDTLDYNPTLRLVSTNARQQATPNGERNFNILRINTLLGMPTEHDIFAQRASMETALNYMDPAAFWGCFFKGYTELHDSENFDHGLNVRMHDDDFLTVKDENNVLKPVFTYITGADIYEKVLKGPNTSSANFANRNRVYIDIRNQFNASYNFYNDNCYTLTPTDDSSYNQNNNLFYALRDGQNAAPPNSNAAREVLIRDYYDTNKLPWLIFDTLRLGADTNSADNAPISTPASFTYNLFGNDKLTNDYSVRLRFPTAGNPSLEQYSLFYGGDTKWKDGLNGRRLVLDPDNKIDNNIGGRENGRIKYLHYNKALLDPDYDKTKEIELYINTVTRPTQVKLAVAAYHRFTFIKHRTKLYTDTEYAPLYNGDNLRLRTHLPLSKRVVKVPLPIDFLDYTFNLNMQLTYGNVAAGKLQNKAAEEYRYADISRATGRDMVGMAGISKDTSGNIILYVNGLYHRRGENAPRVKIEDTDNIRLNITSGLPVTSDSFLKYLKKNTKPDFLQLDVDATEQTETLSMGVNGFPKVGKRSLEFFSYVKIPPSHWQAIQDAYAALFVGTVKPNLSKVYLCFNQVGNSCKTGNKYEYWLKGYLTKYTTTYEVVTVNQKILNIYNKNSFGTFGLEGLPTGFFNTGNTSANRMASFTVAGNVCIIGSTVYSMRGMRLTYQDYYRLSKSNDTDLRKVYSSSINQGLKDILIAKGWTAISYEGEVLQAIPPKFIYFRDNEMMNIVSCIPFVATEYHRSHAHPSNRVSVVFADPGAADTELEKYTMSHEYGHLLGLADRYGYRATMNGTDPLLIDTNGPKGGIPLYIPEDADYKSNYRWYFNLMSLATMVPASFSGLPFGAESDFVNNYTSLKPSTTLDADGYPTSFAIFLTTYQWDIMMSDVRESSHPGNQNLFLFPAGASKLSFAGVDVLAGKSVSDRNFPLVPGSGDMDVRKSSFEPLATITYRNADQIMANPDLQTELNTGGTKTAPKGTLDLTGTHEYYQDIVTPINGTTIGGGTATGNATDPVFGKKVWKHVSPTTPNGSSKPKWEPHPNRVEIIEIISRGG